MIAKRFTIILCLSFFIIISANTFNSDEESIETIDDNQYEQEHVDKLFQSNVDKVKKRGHLKKIWNKFIRDGYVENIDSLIDEKEVSHKKSNRPSKTSNTAQLLETMSAIGLEISKEIMKNKNRSDRNARSIEMLREKQTPPKLCPFLQNKECDPEEKFRSIDGSCNNLEIPLLGKSNTPYKRYMTPAYDDGLETARGLSKSGKALPSPRKVSNLLFKDNFQFDNDYTHIIAFFGQFITHDFSMASISADSFGIPLMCDCGDTNINCLPMRMPSNENIMRMTCMKFTRSSSTFSSFDCKLGYREQLNLLTSYIDASQVYGTEDFKAKNLREMKGGLLKFSEGVNNKPYLPHKNDGACHDVNVTNQCFGAGDSRVNNNLGLAGMHTLFLREHNRIADQLANLNPHWSDERLFNEARRLTIAIYQHIVFTEYLPALIGNNFIRAFELEPKKENEYFTGYNKNVNPSVANEFSSAAFRFGHSLIRSQLGRYNKNNMVMSPSVQISDIIFRPVEAYNKEAGGLDSLFLSAINEPPSKFDTNIADHLQNHLFEVKVSDNMVLADDLAALNINRGRDHGIGSYNVFREKCGFPVAKTFSDLKDLINDLNIEKLESTYEDVDDIDFYVGGLSETPVNGALLGPTFSCIIALQFRDFKKGDRFFYENGPSDTAFDIEQLNEVRKTSLARVICNNFDLNFVQPNVFFQPRALKKNERISCNKVPDIDLSNWKESE